MAEYAREISSYLMNNVTNHYNVWQNVQDNTRTVPQDVHERGVDPVALREREERAATNAKTEELLQAAYVERRKKQITEHNKRINDLKDQGKRPQSQG